MNETILITGGAGFIGSHLAERLLALGKRVVVVDNLSSYYDPARKRSNLKQVGQVGKFVFYNASILQIRKLRNIFLIEKPSKVVHLAANVGVRPSFEQTEDYVRVNILGTNNLLEVASEHRTKQFVFGSSSSVYGKRSGNRGFRETDKPQPASPYAVTKLSAEFLCRKSSDAHKMKTTVLRFFTVYGPRNRPDMACYKFVEATSSGKTIDIFGRGTKRDFTYVDDVVGGIILALKKPFGYEVINLGSSDPVSLLQLVKVIERALDKTAKIRRKPLPQGDVPRTFASTSKARRLLRWRPKVDIDQGIKSLVAWYDEFK